MNLFWLSAACHISDWLTRLNNPDPRGLARPWWDLSRQLKCCLYSCPKLFQPEPKQKPRIAVHLLSFLDSTDATAILTLPDKVGPQEGEHGHFPFKADLVESGPIPISWGPVQGGEHTYGLHTASAFSLTVLTGLPILCYLFGLF